MTTMFAAAYDASSTTFALVTADDKDVDIDLNAYDAKRVVAAYRLNTKDAKEAHEQMKQRRVEMDTFCSEMTLMLDTCRKIGHTVLSKDIKDVDATAVEKTMKDVHDMVMEFKKKFVLHEEKAIKELTEKQAKLQANLTHLREALVKGATLMCAKDTVVQQNVCPICFEKEINRVCVPCGHTLCSTCEFSVVEKCATCRRYVDMCIPIYFSL